MNKTEAASLARKTFAITLITIGVTCIAYGTLNALNALNDKIDE